MKEGIHPNYDVLKVVMTDGTEFETKSTIGGNGKVLRLDIDPKTHPAWTGGPARSLEAAGGKVARFKKRFADFGLK